MVALNITTCVFRQEDKTGNENLYNFCPKCYKTTVLHMSCSSVSQLHHHTQLFTSQDQPSSHQHRESPAEVWNCYLQSSPAAARSSLAKSRKLGREKEAHRRMLLRKRLGGVQERVRPYGIKRGPEKLGTGRETPKMEMGTGEDQRPNPPKDERKAKESHKNNPVFKRYHHRTGVRVPRPSIPRLPLPNFGESARQTFHKDICLWITLGSKLICALMVFSFT